MAILAEYALTPDVFDQETYPNPETCGVHLQYLRESLLNEALARDLRNGDWSTLLAQSSRSFHSRTKELLRALAKERRLRSAPIAIPAAPACDRDWCSEALASHQAENLTGIIATEAVKADFQRETLVARIDRVLNAPWWVGQRPSIRLLRTLSDYLAGLRLVLKCANSVMFIDAHLDPSQARYHDVIHLLRAAGGRTPAPQIEVHRVCYIGSGGNRQIIANAEWETRFRQAWAAVVRSCGISVEVVIWDDFHDRYVVSDLVGIQMENGLDTTTATNSMTTWARMSRDDRDDIQREFDPASNRHALKHRFHI